MGIKKEDVSKALDNLETMAKNDDVNKGDQGSNPPLNSAEGDDLGEKRGEPLSNEAKKKNKKDSDKEENVAKKSFTEALPEAVEEHIDVSDFLKSLVDYTGERMDELSTHIAKSELEQTEARDEVVERFDRIEKSQMAIGVVLKSVCEKLGIIENSPAHAGKADTNVSKSEVNERNFDGEGQEGNGEAMFKSLSKNPAEAKSQVTDSLCDLVKSGDAMDLDVINFESNGYIRPELIGKLKEKLD